MSIKFSFWGGGGIWDFGGGGVPILFLWRGDFSDYPSTLLVLCAREVALTSVNAPTDGDWMILPVADVDQAPEISAIFKN